MGEPIASQQTLPTFNNKAPAPVCPQHMPRVVSGEIVRLGYRLGVTQQRDQQRDQQRAALVAAAGGTCSLRASIGRRVSWVRTTAQRTRHVLGVCATPTALNFAQHVSGRAPFSVEEGQLERATRIELAFSAWEADVLPLNYARVSQKTQSSLLTGTIRQDSSRSGLSQRRELRRNEGECSA